MGDWKEVYKNIRNRQNETNENQLSDNLYTDKGLDSKYQPLSPLTDVNEHAAVNQTKSDVAGNILARGVGTFVTGALGTVAMLHDVPKSMYKAITGDSESHEGWDYYMNNSINADLNKAQQDIMENFPLYDTQKDSKTPFTTTKILDGITQGAAFIGSAWAGGWLTKGVLQSAKLLGNSQRLLNLTNKTGKSLAVDNAINAQIVNYLDKGKNIGAAIYNRSFESMLEAKGTGQEIREDLESKNQEAFDRTGQYLYSIEDIDNRVRQAEKLNFGFNLALGVVDAYQNLKIFDGFESKIGKAISKNIDDVTEEVLSNKNLSKFGLPKLTALGVKYGTKTGALGATGSLEALEELSQFSSNKLSQDLATNNYTKDDWDNLPKLITEITGQMSSDIQNDPNAQFSALIGGLVGLPMGVVAKRSEDKQEALKTKQKEIAQQSLIEKNTLIGLYKIKNGKTLEDKVSGEIQTRFSNHQGFQNTVINQINADNFEGLISHLENIKETSLDDLKELEVGVKTDSKGNVIQPSTIVNEAIEQAKSIKKVYENVNLAHANKSELIRNNITNLILNGKYFDKKIDLVTNELETKKAEILAKITKDQNYAEKAFKTVKSKETGKEDLSFFVNGEIKNANIEELNISPEIKDEVIKLKEELKQLNKEREFTIKEYGKYKDPSYINKVEKEAQKNIENLEKPVEETTVEENTPVETTTVVNNTPVAVNPDVLSQLSPEVATPTSVEPPLEKELNTYFEAPNIFTDVTEANLQDVFVPDNIGENLPTKSLDDLQGEIVKSKKVTKIPKNPKIKFKSFENNDKDTSVRDYLDDKGNTYTFDKEAATTVVKGTDLVLKPLTNNGYGSIGIFTTGKDGKLVSILRMQHFTDPNDPNDRGELVNTENKKLFEQFFGQPFENGGKLKDPSKRGKLKEKKEKAFSVSFSGINLGSPVTITTKPTESTNLTDNIHYDNNGLPTIVRISGKFSEKETIIIGDTTVRAEDIQRADTSLKGDTVLLFTKRKSHTEDKDVYPAIPVTTKPIKETTNFKNKLISLIDNTVNSIQENIKSGKEGKLNETVSEPNDVIRGKLLLEIRNFIRLGDKTVNLPTKVNNSTTYTFEATFPDNSKPLEITITKDSIKGLEEFKDRVLDVFPSFSIESIQALKESNNFEVNDYLEAMSIPVDQNNPIKGVSIEIETGFNKKDLIPHTTITEQPVIEKQSLVLKDIEDVVEVPIEKLESPEELDLSLVIAPSKAVRDRKFNSEINNLLKLVKIEEERNKITDYIEKTKHVQNKDAVLTAIKDYINSNYTGDQLSDENIQCK